jgi:hypothetical protein
MSSTSPRLLHPHTVPPTAIVPPSPASNHTTSRTRRAERHLQAPPARDASSSLVVRQRRAEVGGQDPRALPSSPIFSLGALCLRSAWKRIILREQVTTDPIFPFLPSLQGFDEFMNVVLDNAEEVWIKDTKSRKVGDRQTLGALRLSVFPSSSSSLSKRD